MSRRPAVGITTARIDDDALAGWTEGGYASPTPYSDCVREAGAAPFLIPIADPQEAEVTLDHLDAVVFTGGYDVDPALYGQVPHESILGVSRARDVWESALLASAVDREMPMLAICRGMQLWNVQRGGTLIQHLPDLDWTDRHRGDRVEDPTYHTMHFEPNSKVAEVFGATLANCECIHHQAVDQLGEGLWVTARARDGSAEAVELAGADWFAVGVQWHPERTAKADVAQKRLFSGLVAAAS